MRKIVTRNKILACLVFLIAIGSTVFFCANVTRNSLQEKSEFAGERWETVQKYLKNRGEKAREIAALAVDSSVADSITAAADKLDAAADPSAAYQANLDLSAALLPVEAQDVDDTNRYAEILEELATIDEKVEETRKRYNEVVGEYNELLATPPTKIVAEKYEFRPLPAFGDPTTVDAEQTQNDASETEAPNDPAATVDDSDSEGADFLEDVE